MTGAALLSVELWLFSQVHIFSIPPSSLELPRDGPRDARRDTRALKLGMPIQFSLLAAAPPVDIDFTIFVQLAIFVVLYLVLRPLLFKPWIEVLERRTLSIDGALQAASELRDQADRFGSESEARMEKAQQDALHLRSDARVEAEAAQHKLLGEARSQASTSMDSARETARREATVARAELASKVQDISNDVFATVMGRSA